MAALAASRMIGDLTFQEVGTALRASSILCLPMGSMEQHGPHLPLNTDTVLAEAFTGRIVERWGEAYDLWRLPSITVGLSREHDWAARARAGEPEECQRPGLVQANTGQPGAVAAVQAVSTGWPPGRAHRYPGSHQTLDIPLHRALADLQLLGQLLAGVCWAGERARTSAAGRSPEADTTSRLVAYLDGEPPT